MYTAIERNRAVPTTLHKKYVLIVERQTGGNFLSYGRHGKFTCDREWGVQPQAPAYARTCRRRV